MEEIAEIKRPFIPRGNEILQGSKRWEVWYVSSSNTNRADHEYCSCPSEEYAKGIMAGCSIANRAATFIAQYKKGRKSAEEVVTLIAEDLARYASYA